MDERQSICDFLKYTINFLHPVSLAAPGPRASVFALGRIQLVPQGQAYGAEVFLGHCLDIPVTVETPFRSAGTEHILTLQLNAEPVLKESLVD